MALTTIFTGMEKGPEAINKNFKDNLLEISAWTDAGMTYINGNYPNSNDMANTLKYRTIKLGGVLMETQFCGWFNMPAVNRTLGVVEISKFPSEIFRSGFALSSNRIESFSTDQYIAFGVNPDDSALYINLWPITKEFPDGKTIMTNLCVSW